MAFNTHYTRFTYQQMIEDFTNRLRSDEKFKKLSAASIYQMFMEMLTGTIDMTNFYMQRVAEESFMHTAKLDSSIIKHAATLGYSPKKPTPAEVEVAIVLKGPLPAELQAGATVYFSQEDVKLSFNGNPYILATDYSYTFTAEDINDGRDNSSWSKTIVMSKKAENMKWLPLAGIKYYKAGDVQPIKAYQAEFADVEIKGVSNLRKLGKNYQFYDINDLEFSNWFGRRDPSSYNYGRYVKHSGYTKIGIGKTKDEAFNSDGSNLYDIEDYSIFLNPDVLANDMPKSPLKVCAVTTNSDKTTRIQFGDGILVDNGLSVNSDNIYVRYLKTRGATANTVGTTGSMFQCSTDFFATQAGSIVDISSNVQILLNSDITAGADFESALSIKNHAPLYYAAAGRLITKNDFESYFTSLTTPIKVKNASAWGQDEVEALGTNGTVTYKYLQNVVLYCLAASTYNINGKLNSVRNVLDDEDETFGAFTVYGSGTKYLEHLTDYIKLLLSTKSFDTQQYAKNPSQQWQKNVKKIRENVQDKMLIGTKLYSMPPFVQYFDVVGTVEVDSLSKLQQYKIDVENKIYEWLDENTTFRKPIYKADIIKFFNERPETKSVNLDIKVSELIKSDKSTFSFAVGPNSGLYSINRNLPGAPDRDYIDKDEVHYQNYNTITIPKTDANNASISVDAFKNKNIIVSLNNGGTEVNKFQFTPYEVSETSTSFILSMYGYQTSQVQQIADNAVFYISVAGSADFASTSNLSVSNAAAYGLDADQTRAVIADVKEWMSACKPALTQANRPIQLPYTIETMDEVTRDETIYRLGSVQQGDLEKELTEKSFWQHFVPYLINKYYGHDSLKGELLEQSVNGDLWNGITNLVLDIYRQMKVVFCDSILDDNNNIIDYSMDNELPVVRLNITYKYRA